MQVHTPLGIWHRTMIAMISLNVSVFGREKLRVQTGRTSMRRTAVRETGVSHHNEGKIERPSEPLRKLQHYRIEKFNGGPHKGSNYAERRKCLGQPILDSRKT